MASWMFFRAGNMYGRYVPLYVRRNGSFPTATYLHSLENWNWEKLLRNLKATLKKSSYLTSAYILIKHRNILEQPRTNGSSNHNRLWIQFLYCPCCPSFPGLPIYNDINVSVPNKLGSAIWVLAHHVICIMRIHQNLASFTYGNHPPLFRERIKLIINWNRASCRSIRWSYMVIFSL